MQFLLVEGKHENRYIDLSVGKVRIAREIALERMSYGCYNKEEENFINSLITSDCDTLFNWLKSRNSYEYEGFSVEDLEIL